MAMDTPFKLILGSSSPARREILAEMGYHFSVMNPDIDEKVIRREKPEDLVMALAQAKAEAIIGKLHAKCLSNKKVEGEPTLLITSDQFVKEMMLVALYVGGKLQKSEDGVQYTKDAAFGFEINENTTFQALKELIYEKTDVNSNRYHTCDTLRRIIPWCSSSRSATFQSEFENKVMVNREIIREKPLDEEEAREFIKGYSGHFATAVGYVLVTNLKTGVQRGGWDKPQIHFHEIPDDVIERVMKVRDIINVAGGFRMEHPLAAPYVKEVIGAMDSVMGLPKQLTKRLLQEALEETCA